MGGQLWCAVVTVAYRRGAAGVNSLLFSQAQAGFVRQGSLLLSFFKRKAFALQKLILLKMIRRSRKAFAPIWRFANKFNLPLHSATRANTLYSVLTALCSHPKTFPLKSFGRPFSKGRGGVGGNAPDICRWSAGQRPKKLSILTE